jgi:tRNA uridine 5-carboxymethylaminomethyl modification enzyme
MKRNDKYDIIVIGGGHAGIEASQFAAKMGCKTALITMSNRTIGRPSCNPSIGGSAKGHLVKELDAMGGAMGFIADRAGIHFKMLNISKGPAIWSPRAQIDKDLYPLYAREYLFRMKNLDLVEAMVDDIIIEKGIVKGILTSDNETISAQAVILCSGTFLNGVMHTGHTKTSGGRVGERPAKKISDNLKSYGLERGRLKTGTPPRVLDSSINIEKTEISRGDEYPQPFSMKSSEVKNRISCYHTETSEKTHDILREGFEESPMFAGRIQGAGPRYCPSIEDKINRFSDKNSHKILLEPEGLSTHSVYVNGFSTSLPEDVQERGLRTIPGLEECKIIRPGYAIEYDFFFPYQLRFSMETKAIEGLYFAGQLNGTSGYEEAGVQGMMAGINAALKIQGKEEFTLKRSEAYTGVLIDDLVNKSTEEPYRIFTSLAEYRLMLRQDNATDRLSKYAFDMGLLSIQEFDIIQRKLELIDIAKDELKKIKIKTDVANPYLESVGESLVDGTQDLYTLAKRSKCKVEELLGLAEKKSINMQELLLNKEALLGTQLEIKYEGYIKRQLKDIEYFLTNENKRIPDNFDYNELNSISTESREKLSKIKPQSLGQASRISGVSASDVSILALYLK